MKLVVGLGNPGGEYAKTRHNAGHLFCDELQRRNKNKSLIIKKSDTFMNSSGVFVKKMVEKLHIDPRDLYVVHDDLDILLGSFKIQFGRGPKDHNGIASVDRELGTDQYWHVRIGVDKRDPENRVLGEEYVLQEFTSGEKEILDEVIRKVCKKLLILTGN